MKLLAVYLVAWPCYWLGDLISKPMLLWDWAFLYPTYNRLMCWSSDIDDWAGGEHIWKTPSAP